MNKEVLIYQRQIQGVKNTIAVSYRNAEQLSKELNCDLLMYDTDKLKQKKYDIIICTYFNRYTDYKTLKSLIKPNQKRFLIRTEYEPVNCPMKEFKPYIEVGQNFENPDLFLNFNLLIARKPNNLAEKKYDCVYYSRYRKERMSYCKEYLQGGIYFSTHPKNHKHFFHYGCSPKLIKDLDWGYRKEVLNNFKYSLYLEDPFSHTTFTGLGSRWYEAGFCNNVVFFDINCKNTFLKSNIGHFIDEAKYYFVSSHDELMSKINECNNDFLKHLKIQKRWRENELNERQDMINRFKSIIYNGIR